MSESNKTKSKINRAQRLILNHYKRLAKKNKHECTCWDRNTDCPNCIVENFEAGVYNGETLDHFNPEENAYMKCINCGKILYHEAGAKCPKCGCGTMLIYPRELV